MNHNGKFLNDTHIGHLDFIYIYWVARQDIPTWQWRTFTQLNFNKRPGITISCQDSFQHIFNGTLYCTKIGDVYRLHSDAHWCRHPSVCWAAFGGVNTLCQWMQVRSNCHQQLKLH
jgi:hypothetical protein